MKTKLIGIDGTEGIYSIGLFNIEGNEYEKIITCFSFYDLKEELTRIYDDTCHIIFNNEIRELSNYLIANYKDSLLSSENHFSKRIYGVFPSERIKTYGVEIQAVKNVENVTNIINYIILKNKGL